MVETVDIYDIKVGETKVDLCIKRSKVNLGSSFEQT